MIKCPKHLKNTIKLSYTWYKNIGSVITSLNRRTTQPTSNNQGYNSRNRATWPLNNKCLTVNIVFKEVVSAPNKLDKKYLDFVETVLNQGSSMSEGITTQSVLLKQGA